MGSAGADVVRPLVVSRETDLVFGTVFAGQVAGRVTVGADARTTYSGGVNPACVSTACIVPSPAMFGVRGEPRRSYHVHLPGQVLAQGSRIDGGGAAVALLVDDLEVTTAGAGVSGPDGILDGAGLDRFLIGGTLHVPAQLPAAHYRATVPIIVTYS